MLTPQQQKYIAWELTKSHSTSDDDKFTSVLTEAQVDLNPHQIDAALFAFRSPLSKGAILADEVCLGKTIEAALVIAQKWDMIKKRKDDMSLYKQFRDNPEFAANFTSLIRRSIDNADYLIKF